MKAFIITIAALCFSKLGFSSAQIDPLSKIIITSVKASSVPLKEQQSCYLVQYRDHVKVELADQTTITGNVLDVVVTTKLANNFGSKKNSSLILANQNKKASNVKKEQLFKTITMTGDVVITRPQQVVSADKAELLVPEKKCKAYGHVKIAQTKKNPRDVPFEIESNYALIDLNTEELLLQGSQKKPVSTIIELNNQRTKILK
jgi:lipopolysaccharide assembly outer membrane protein LptD (OstA)